MERESRRPILSTREAEARVAQLRVLADPDAIRIMTVIATSPEHVSDPARLATLTGHTSEGIEALITRLVEAELLVCNGDAVTITDSAWLRYRRLLLDKAELRPSADDGWSGYPAAIKRLAAQLSLRFERTFNSETIDHYVKASFDDLRSRAVTGNHLVLLTSRLVHDRLGKIAASQGVRLRRVPRVLFVCTHNSGRSQLATALLRQRASGRVEVSSAGVDVRASVNAHVYAALAEVGVPPLVDPPSPVDRATVSAADFVVTMGCGDVCPIVPGPRYFDWPITDPAPLGLDGYRQALTAIDERIDRLLRDLL